MVPLGPDCLLGYGYADTLSFELSPNGQRVLVSAGIFKYDRGVEHQWEHDILMYHAVVVHGAGLSEVWGNTRGARLLRPFGVRTSCDAESGRLEEQHDCYIHLPGRVVHHRQWSPREFDLMTSETMSRRIVHAKGGCQFKPGIDLSIRGRNAGGVTLGNGKMCWCMQSASAAYVEESSRHGCPGSSVRCRLLVNPIDGSPLQLSFRWY